MQFNKKQSEQFVKRYKDRYGDLKELPIAHDEELEIQEWKKFLRKLLGKMADETYKTRRWGDETVLENVFNWLWLEYGPVIK